MAPAEGQRGLAKDPLAEPEVHEHLDGLADRVHETESGDDRADEGLQTMQRGPIARLAALGEAGADTRQARGASDYPQPVAQIAEPGRAAEYIPLFRRRRKVDVAGRERRREVGRWD